MFPKPKCLSSLFSIWFVSLLTIRNRSILALESNITAVNRCQQARTCSECISISNECKWCAQDTFTGQHRCSNHFTFVQCPINHQIDPQSHRIEILENRPFNDSMYNTVQLRPQRIKIDTRVDSVASISVYFKQATDYPMDLYYLMDISCTMLKHKTSVSRVGRKLATKIKSTTKDFRIGFGSYVDKETIPFSNYKFDNQTNCNKIKMVDTYSFINHMKLSADTGAFEKNVFDAQISGNLDSPEGTLDALMQVMVCGDEIGWRKQSDKIIVVATDEEFHYAGDGKIGGILIPNDGKCHLKDNRYIGSTIYDYPSMHHIAEVAQKNKFNLVFTVRDKVLPDYQILSDIVGANSRVASLKVNDDTIAELIDEVYQNISNRIELSVEHAPDNVEVEIWTNCASREHNEHREQGERLMPRKLQLNAKQPLVRTSSCRISGKEEIAFQIRIRLKHCSSLSERSELSNLIRIGLLNKNETIDILLNELCQCDCELSGETNSAHCSRNGTYSCGICTTCNGIRSGDQCECDPDKPIDPKRPDAHCKQSGDSRPCSGHGRCVCAKCVCESMFAGEFCERDESACYQNGVKCNGQGECRDHRCVCNEQFSGEFCDCPLDTGACVSNHSTGQLCSGRGECRCGRCECKTATAYGVHCEKCPLCDAPQYCDRIRSCVKEFSHKFCQPQFDPVANRTLPSPCNPELCLEQSTELKWQYEIVDSLSHDNTSDSTSSSSSDSDSENSESFSGEYDNQADPELNLLEQSNVFNYQCQQVINGCDVSFAFRLIRKTIPQILVQGSNLADLGNGVNLAIPDDELLHFMVTNYTELCPQKVNLVVVGSSAFGTVLLIGLLTIVGWKVLTEYLDRREYERFIREVDCASFSQVENPLYKEVTATFRNPVFGLRDRTSKFFFNKK